MIDQQNSRDLINSLIEDTRHNIENLNNAELDHIKRKTKIISDQLFGKNNDYSKEILKIDFFDTERDVEFLFREDVYTKGNMLKNILSEIKFTIDNGLVVLPDNKSNKLDGKIIAKSSIILSPLAFNVPGKPIESNLVSVMMPFDASFDKVLERIRSSCSDSGLACKRVDDIWNNSIIIQDIFELIYCSSVVIVDFSKKNSNVFYEAGIAHTLGKHVIPITQIDDDVPFNLKHHKYIKYLNNSEGLQDLEQKLKGRLAILKSKIKS